jgi:hypothetical protein
MTASGQMLTLFVTESRPLHPTQRTNAEASLKVCVGPVVDVDSLGAARQLDFRWRT